MDLLKQDSKSKNCSTAERIFQILIRHYTFEVFFKEEKAVFVSKEFFKKLLDQINENKIFKIALHTTIPLVRRVVSQQAESTIEVLIHHINQYLYISQLQYEYKVINHIHKYKIIHYLGKKYSIYLSAIMDCLVDESGYKITTNSLSKDSVSFDIEVAFPI